MGRLSKKALDEVDEMILAGYTQSEIAKKHNISVSTVQRRRKALQNRTTEAGSAESEREVYSAAFRIFGKGGNAVDVVKALNVKPSEARELEEWHVSLNSRSKDMDASNTTMSMNPIIRIMNHAWLSAVPSRRFRLTVE